MRPLSHSTLFPYTTLFRSHLVDVLAAAREKYRLRAPGDRSCEDRHEAAGVDDERDPRRHGGEEAVRRPEERHSEVVRSSAVRSEEHTLNSSHVAISYAVFC